MFGCFFFFVCHTAAIHLFTCTSMFVFFPQAIAADCKRVTVLKYFLEALCGQEEPLLAFKGGKYISVATPPSNQSRDMRSRQDSLTEKEVLPLISSAHLALQDIFTADATIFFSINYVNAGCEEAGEGSETQITMITSHLCVCVFRQSDDVIVEAESSLSASEEEVEAEEVGDSENDIRQLKARRHALANKLAQQQKRKDKIQVKLFLNGFRAGRMRKLLFFLLFSSH